MSKTETDAETMIKAGARAAGKPPGSLDKAKPDLSDKGQAPKDPDSKGR